MTDPRDVTDVEIDTGEDRLCEAALTFERSVEAGRPLTVPQLQALFPGLPVADLQEIVSSEVQMGRRVGELLGSPSPSTVDFQPGGDVAGEPPVDPDSETLRKELRATRPLVRLQRGGIGAVYRCEEPGLGRELAVKVLRRKYGGRADIEKRFIAEAHIGARLESTRAWSASTTSASCPTVDRTSR